jgi:hypothetical protein
MIYRDLESFAHFNEPTENIAAVSVSGDKAHFTLNPGLTASASFVAGNSLDVILDRRPGSREIFSMTIGEHPLVGVRKWAVRKSKVTVVQTHRVDIDTEAYEQVNGLTNKRGRRMSGRGQQDKMWSTYLENIADYWGRTQRATVIERQFYEPEAASTNINPFKAVLPAALQKTRYRDYDEIIQY